MRVVTKPYEGIIFVELEVGECFKYNGELYIRTDSEIVRAIALKDGNSAFFKDGDRVERVNAEVSEV